MPYVTRAAAALAVAVAVGACAGEPPTRRGPKQDVGHGSVEEVVAALGEERMPCTDVRPEELDGMEQRVSCRVGSDRITIVHFVNTGQAAEFERSTRAAGDHGVFHELWGAVVPSRGLAERIAAAVESTSFA